MPFDLIRRQGFIHVPKNAGSALQEALDYQRYRGHISIRKLEKKLPLHQFYVFAVLRDPFARAVSNYQYTRHPETKWHSISGRDGLQPHPDYALVREASFASYCQLLTQGRLQGLGVWPQVHFLKDRHYRCFPFSRIFLFERLNEELPQALHHDLGISVSLPQVNVQDYAYRLEDWYDETTFGIVADHYTEDLQWYRDIRKMWCL